MEKQNEVCIGKIYGFIVRGRLADTKTLIYVAFAISKKSRSLFTSGFSLSK